MREVLGIIAPHPPVMVESVGGSRAAVTQASIDALRVSGALLADFAPDSVIVSSPHAPLARNGFLVQVADVAGDLAQFGAPNTTWRATTDVELARAVLAEASAVGIDVAALEDVTTVTRADHGMVVPLSFLDPRGSHPVVALSPSFLTLEAHFDFGRAIRSASEHLGRKVAYIASGDLSHRLTPDAPAGFSPRAHEFDRALVEVVRSARLADLLALDARLAEEAGECGLRSFAILAGFLEGDEVRSRVLSYEAPWGVGYLSAVVASPTVVAHLDPERGHKGGFPGDEESPPVALARRAIETYLRDGTVLTPPDDPALARRAGAFVSLHRGSDLRGCIGTIQPTTPTLAEEIVSMAIEAATHDPRFPRLEPSELADLEISVDVLDAPQPVEGLEELDPSAFGVIVSCDWRRGLLLPDLDGVDSVEQQVAIARRKAGIGPDEPISLERFRVERFL